LHGKPATFCILVSDGRAAGPGHVDFNDVANLPALGLEFHPERVRQLKHAVATVIRGVLKLDCPTFWGYHKISSG
jgi:hypothetical protein